MIPSAATGVGSMPGTSPAEATAVVVGELPGWPALPELPARGAGADMVGRTAAALLAVDPAFALAAVPTGWCRTGQVGPDMRRARSWLGEDLDRFEEALTGYAGPAKLQFCGPWTWAAAVEDVSGRRLVRDAGFVADLAEALGLAVRMHVAEVQRRVPGAAIVVQFDEPGLPAVLAGTVPTASGLGRLAAVAAPQAVDLLDRCRDRAAVPAVLHCCAAALFDIARRAGFPGVSWDASGVGFDPESAAAAHEAGLRLLPGAVSPGGTLDGAWHAFREWWRRTGLAAVAAHHVAITPACGLAGATAPQARATLATARDLQRRIAEWDA